MRNRALSIEVLVLTACVVLAAQAERPSFEAATVKLNRSGGADGFFPSPGRLRATNSTVQQLIQAAYHTGEGALIGAAGWMETERYDIEGSTTAASSFDDELLMLQGVLEDRFRLRFHREMREMATLALVRSKAELKMPLAAAPGQKERVRIVRGEILGTNIRLGHLVSILQAQLGIPVSNETGLTGEFDVSLHYDPGDSVEGSTGPSVFAAVEEQLGLKLERRKRKMEVMVIDSAERPEGD